VPDRNPPLAASPANAPLKKLDAAVIAPRPTRRYRAAAFQVYVLFAAAGFITLAVAARFVPYFAIDLTITRAVQAYQGPFFDRLMFDISWLGFMPQGGVLATVTIAALFFTGLRWEALSTIFAAGAIGVGTVVKLIVFRPRPSSDLVHVIAQLPTSGFPSGHVLAFTGIGGFLGFLVFTLLKPSWERTTLLVAFALLVGLMGLSRIYEGQHWFSDVMGAYLLGSLWLALTIKVYRWGKPHVFPRQPVAPEAPPAPAAGGGS
jgi:undecaprenyl-diphosphatase